MSVKQSTGFRNARLSGDSVRKIFADAVIRVYSGTAPATADAAVTGTLLIEFTKASGVVSVGEVSTAKEAKLVISSFAEGETFIVTVNGISYTYVALAGASAISVAAAVALMLDITPDVEANACGTATIYIRAKIPGVNFTITKSGTGTHTLSDDAVANAASDALKFLAASSGSMSKNTDVWSGVGLAEGTAGYCRVVQSVDTGTLSTTEKRLQGNVSTSGSEMTLTSVSIHVGATNTLDTATITEPASD